MTMETNQTGQIGGNPRVSSSVSVAREVGTNIAASQSNRKEKVATQIELPGFSEPKPVQKAAIEIQDKDIARLNDYVQSTRRSLEFRVDDATNRTIVTVIDKDTQAVIRQIPSESALKLAQQLSSMQDPSGSLFEDRA